MKFIENNDFGMRLLQVDTWADAGVFHGFGARDFDLGEGTERWGRRFLDIPLLLLQQRHSKTIIHFHPENTDIDWKALDEHPLFGDAWILDYRAESLVDSVCGLRTADAFPVLVRSTKVPIVAAIHCGWRAAEAGLLLDTLVLLGRLGVPTKTLEVVIGPGAQSCCYEIQGDVKSHVERAHLLVESMCLEPLPPVTIAREGKFYANLPSLLRAQALFFGVKPAQILTSDACTICDSRYFSFRREKELAGRQLTFIGHPRCG